VDVGWLVRQLSIFDSKDRKQINLKKKKGGKVRSFFCFQVVISATSAKIKPPKGRQQKREPSC
jgi:hypothetical protein